MLVGSLLLGRILTKEARFNPKTTNGLPYFLLRESSTLRCSLGRGLNVSSHWFKCPWDRRCQHWLWPSPQSSATSQRGYCCHCSQGHFQRASSALVTHGLSSLFLCPTRRNCAGMVAGDGGEAVLTAGLPAACSQEYFPRSASLGMGQRPRGAGAITRSSWAAKLQTQWLLKQ